MALFDVWWLVHLLNFGEEEEELKKVASHDKRYAGSPVFIRIQPPSTNLHKTEITGKCNL